MKNIFHILIGGAITILGFLFYLSNSYAAVYPLVGAIDTGFLNGAPKEFFASTTAPVGDMFFTATATISDICMVQNYHNVSINPVMYLGSNNYEFYNPIPAVAVGENLYVFENTAGCLNSDDTYDPSVSHTPEDVANFITSGVPTYFSDTQSPTTSFSIDITTPTSGYSGGEFVAFGYNISGGTPPQSGLDYRIAIAWDTTTSTLADNEVNLYNGDPLQGLNKLNFINAWGKYNNLAGYGGDYIPVQGETDPFYSSPTIYYAKAFLLASTQGYDYCPDTQGVAHPYSLCFKDKIIATSSIINFYVDPMASTTNNLPADWGHPPSVANGASCAAFNWLDSKTWGCNAYSGTFDFVNAAANLETDAFNGATVAISKTFIFQPIVMLNQDIKQAQVSTSTDSSGLVFAGTGKIFGGRSFTIFSATTTDWIENIVGFDYRGFFDKILYLFTGLIILGSTILIIKSFHSTTGGASMTK